VYICIAIGDAIIKRWRAGIPLAVLTTTLKIFENCDGLNPNG
jgi:hypothetical protein